MHERANQTGLAPSTRSPHSHSVARRHNGPRHRPRPHGVCVCACVCACRDIGPFRLFSHPVFSHGAELHGTQRATRKLHWRWGLQEEAEAAAGTPAAEATATTTATPEAAAAPAPEAAAEEVQEESEKREEDAPAPIEQPSATDDMETDVNAVCVRPRSISFPPPAVVSHPARAQSVHHHLISDTGRGHGYTRGRTRERAA